MPANAVLPDDISRNRKSFALHAFLQVTGPTDPASLELTARVLTSTLATFRAVENQTRPQA